MVRWSRPEWTPPALQRRAPSERLVGGWRPVRAPAGPARASGRPSGPDGWGSATDMSLADGYTMDDHPGQKHVTSRWQQRVPLWRGWCTATLDPDQAVLRLGSIDPMIVYAGPVRFALRNAGKPRKQRPEHPLISATTTRVLIQKAT